MSGTGEQRFRALAFAWDEMLSEEERCALVNLAPQLQASRRLCDWRELNGNERLQLVRAARQAVQLGQTCAQMLLIDAEALKE